MCSRLKSGTAPNGLVSYFWFQMGSTVRKRSWYDLHNSAGSRVKGRASGQMPGLWVLDGAPALL